MPDEKYVGYCSRCADYPPFFQDIEISINLLYNPWCLFCDKKIKGDPTSFWPKGKIDRFFYKCECGWETPIMNEQKKIIDTSPEFGQVLVDHFFYDHKMYISDALIMTGHISSKEVISKYLIPNPERQ